MTSNAALAVLDLDHPTEPIPDRTPTSSPASTPTPPPPTPSSLDRLRFQFMSGIPAGETAYIRADDGSAILSYRSFATVIGIVAVLMSAIVLFAGVAGAAFLLLERRPIPATAALLLSAAFAALIILLIPASQVTIFEGSAPAIAIRQRSGVNILRSVYGIATPDGAPIGSITTSLFSRLGRNRWLLQSATNSAQHGEAIEESLAQALVRKTLGKFSASYQSNLRIVWNGEEAGWIIRRPGADGHADLLVLNPETTLDRRMALALATLVLGSEP